MESGSVVIDVHSVKLSVSRFGQASKDDPDCAHILANLVLLEKSTDIKFERLSMEGTFVKGISLHCKYRNSFEMPSRLPLTLHPSKIKKCRYSILAKSSNANLCSPLLARLSNLTLLEF
ncbi:hypothetical protein M758_9G095900 [Ceratodon purpureus]|nr:hypothetical protein M758_9G095900 [Ceratodon purpureus]